MKAGVIQSSRILVPAEAVIPDSSCLGEKTGMKGIEAVCNNSLEHVRGQPPHQEGGEMPSCMGNQRRKRVVETDPMGSYADADIRRQGTTIKIRHLGSPAVNEAHRVC